MTSFVALLILTALVAAIWYGVRVVKSKIGTVAENMSRLVREGTATTGQITATTKRRMSRGEFEYCVTYSFTAKDGREFDKEQRVQATRFDEYVEGQPIDIVYLPIDPSVNATREMVDKVRNTPVAQE